MCGTMLVVAEPDGREERKVVSVLFCDLVGFTSRSEAMDVEDVRGTLQPYHELLRSTIEGFGGTVEKFIGDAVMAVFGAPVVHEDDAERAVRAGLAILDEVGRLRERDARLDLHVRIGVNTGEALVALSADPLRGEGMASGDVVNTGARLESAAPTDGVLVGETTYRATRGSIVYEPADPVSAKGKADLVAAWRAVEARSRFGLDTDQGSRVAMVGRERELDALRDAAERAFDGLQTQLVTVVGVPGIGKSRLVWELSRWAGQRPELIRWRQGRCLPYGDGVTYWALGEIFKAEAGILESDDAAATAAKSDAMLDESHLDSTEWDWVRRNVTGLLGLSDGQAGTASRDEMFAAWRRLLEGLAETGPTVIVFEDLHWADDAMLDFIDHLTEWAGDVPLLIACTARPELLERRRDWGGGKPNAITIALRPLSDDDTRSLVASLVERVVMPETERDALLERAAGNPLYAEEYVRMLHDGGSLSEAVAAELPESVQGIIAARLDALSHEEKQTLQNAAVLGKVVWLGALAALGEADRWQLEDHLHRLTRKEFLRRAQRSSVQGEVEYAFRHVLVRDVAYGQIPRAQRAAKHRRAAEWIEALSADRNDAVEMRAHHLSQALEYANAAGLDTTGLAAEARSALRAAADRAFRLDAYASAATHYRAALELTTHDAPDRGYLLLELGRSLERSGAPGTAELEQAIELLRAADPAAAGFGHAVLAGALSTAGDGEGRRRQMGLALELVAGTGASIYRAQVLLNAAVSEAVTNRPADMLPLLDEYLAIAEAAGVSAEEIVSAHAYRGIARVLVGDLAGLDEEAQAVEAIRAGGYFSLPSAVANLGFLHLTLGHVSEAKLHNEEAVAAFESKQPWRVIGALGSVANCDYLAGDWDAALARATACEALASSGRASVEGQTPWMRTKARILNGRGEPTAAAVAGRALELARDEQSSELCPALAESARFALAAGDTGEATRRLDELLSAAADAAAFASVLGDVGAELAETAEALDRGSELAARLKAVPQDGRNRARTCDLPRVKRTLSQLSYAPRNGR